MLPFNVEEKGCWGLEAASGLLLIFVDGGVDSTEEEVAFLSKPATWPLSDAAEGRLEECLSATSDVALSSFIGMLMAFV